MKRENMRRLLIIGSLLALLAPLASHAAEPEDIIKYRQNTMKAIGGHTAAAGAIVQGKVDYQNQLAEHVRALQALTRDIPGLFPPDSDFGKTRAKDAVWDDRAEFEKRAKDATARVATFAKAVKSGKRDSMISSFKNVGEGCKGCHKDFRKKDD